MSRFLLPLAFLVSCSPSGLGPVDSLFSGDRAEAEQLAGRMAVAYLEGDAARHLRGVDSLVQAGVSIDGLENAHVRLRQTYNGLRVIGGETIVHIASDGEITELTSAFKRHVDCPAYASLSAEDAEGRAVAAVGNGAWVRHAPELVVLRHGGSDHLVYEIDLIRNVDGDLSAPRVYIDATQGDLVHRYENLQTLEGSAHTAYNGPITLDIDHADGGFALHGEGYATWNAGGSISPFDWTPIVSETTVFDDHSAADAHFGLAETLSYFRFEHGHDGMDGAGGPVDHRGAIPMGVHFGQDEANAFWTGEAMIFGDGDGERFGALTSLDVVAHEFTHGVTEFTAGLIYFEESGALNESMSDVFGAVLDHRINGPGPHVWQMGEDSFTPGFEGDALRYMNDPTLDGSSTDHYATRYVGGADNGGVHWNSGIGNLAFYLASEGGTHPNPEWASNPVQGIGIDAAAAIWFHGLTHYMTPDTNFDQARTALVLAAGDLFGPDSAEAKAVDDAWETVGVGTGIELPPEDQVFIAPVGDTIHPLAATTETLSYLVPIPPDVPALRVRITGGTGDADLFVDDELGNLLCDAAQDGNEEVCEFRVEPGLVRITLYPYTPYEGVTLRIEDASDRDGKTPTDLDILRAANGLSHGSLIDFLGVRAADSVFFNRQHDSVAALDALPFVGNSALESLGALGVTMPREDVFGIPPHEAQAVLDFLNQADLATLVVDGGIPSDVASRILERVPFTDLWELERVAGFHQGHADSLLRLVTQ